MTKNNVLQKEVEELRNHLLVLKEELEILKAKEKAVQAYLNLKMQNTKSSLVFSTLKEVITEIEK